MKGDDAGEEEKEGKRLGWETGWLRAVMTRWLVR